MPRFVSLKADRTNLREGPSKDHRTTWVYQRAGLPVEITGEYGMWRKVRDSDGTEGWVLHNLLSGRRTAIVAPWKKGSIFTLYIRAGEDSAPRRPPAAGRDRRYQNLRWQLVRNLRRRV